MRISDWSANVCSSDLQAPEEVRPVQAEALPVPEEALPAREEVRRAPAAAARLLLRAVRPRPVHRQAVRVALQVLAIPAPLQIGRASCRESVCQYVSISVVAVSLKKKKNKNQHY